MKRFLAAVVAVAALAMPVAALAFTAESGQDVTLAKGQTKAGTYYVAGRAIVIDGDVDGDLVCAGNSISVNGAVHGDVICGGQTITVNGPVDGSVRVAGQVVNLNGTIGRNGMVATQSLAVGSAAKIGGDLGLVGQTASVNGPVTKDVYGALDNLTLGSTVGGVTARLNSLSLGPDAKVNGDLQYYSPDTFNIDSSKVTGQVKRTAVEPHRAQADNAARAELAYRLYWMFGALVVGLAFILLAPKLVTRVTKVMREQPGSTIGWGLIVTLLGPIVLILLMITVIGIPLALLAGVVWLVLVTTSGIFAGIAAGEWFVDRAEWRRQPLLWATLLGVPLSVIIFSVPVLGWLLGLIATFWAIGGIALSAKAARG